MFKFIKGIFQKYLSLSMLQYEQSLRRISTFDIVTFTANPKHEDLYVVYQIRDNDIVLIRWVEYAKDNSFTATMDNMLIYDFYTIRDNAYKVVDQNVNAAKLIMYATPGELQALAKRINHAYYASYPLMGIYKDKRNQHIMLIASMTGTADSGYCIVYDMTLAKTYGITHTNQIIHIARARDLINSQVIRAIELEDIVTLFNGAWRQEILNNITANIFKAIRTSEMKFDTFRLFVKDYTCFQKLQEQTNTMNDSVGDKPTNTVKSQKANT